MWRSRVLLTKAVSLAATFLVGCSTNPKPTQPVPTAPQTTTEPPLTAAPITTLRITPSSTLAPYVPPVVLVNPTMPPVDYPPGATEADLKAAEAAALNFWNVVNQQFASLPNYDEDAILARTYPGKAASRKVLATLEQTKRRGERVVVQGSINQQRVNSVEIVAPFLINLEVCLADNGYVVDSSGNIGNTDLGASYVIMVIKRRAGTWLVADYATSHPYAPGKSCAD